VSTPATRGIELLDERGRRLALVGQSDHASAFGAPTVTIAHGALLRVLDNDRLPDGGLLTWCGKMKILPGTHPSRRGRNGRSSG
jgi:hypothetical protein